MLEGLYGIANGTDPEGIASMTEALLASGARVVQVRWKHAPAGPLIALVRALMPRCHEAGARCLVNDRVDVAAIAGADGVHLGDDDLPLETVRAQLPAGAWVGISTHSLDGVDAAVRAGADYLGFGPVFETDSRPDPSPVVHLEGLRAAVVRAGKVPVVAIGGIGTQNIADVARTGCAAAAVIADIVGASDPAATARSLHQEFLRAAA